MVAFRDRVGERLRARAGRRQWREISARLSRLEGGGGTLAEGALRDVASRLTRSGLVVLISDLLVSDDETITALRYLRHHGHEVIVFHLIDPGERDLPTTPEARFLDPETGEATLVNAADVRSEYRIAVSDAIAEWKAALMSHSIDYHLVATDEPLSRALRACLGKRERLG